MKGVLIAMPRTHTGSVAVIHRVDASFRHGAFWSYSKPQDARTHYVEVKYGSRRLEVMANATVMV